MKNKFILPRVMMLFMFGLILNSCTANEEELQIESGKPATTTQPTAVQGQKDEVSATATVNVVVPPPIPNDNEPIIVKPRK